jgi:hypothetical protein
MMASVAVQGHHSLAGVYDMKKEAEEVSGAVQRVQFVHPHGSLTIGVKNPDGTTTDWVVKWKNRRALKPCPFAAENTCNPGATLLFPGL